MGWLEAQERYHQGRTPTDQAVEDLVARRVLRGLGFVQKNLPRMERAIFGDADFDEAVWPRTLKLLKYALTTEGHARYAEEHVIECYEAKGSDHKDILERLSEVSPHKITEPVFMTRIKDTMTSMTYSIWDREAFPDFIQPPFSAIVEIPGMTESGTTTCNFVIVQETEHFVKQFMRNDLFRPAVERAINA